MPGEDSVTVREATVEDGPAVLALMAELGRPPVADDPSAQLRVFEDYVADPDRAILLALVDGSVAGACSLCIRSRLNWTVPEAWIPDLVVSEAYRRRGAARALLDACAARARARGCHRLRLESGWRREEAHALYDAYGFRRAGLDFQLPLEG